MEAQNDQLAVSRSVPEDQDNFLYLDRRKFFKLLGGGLAVMFLSDEVLSFASEASGTAEKIPVNQIGAWLHIAEDGKVTVFTGKVEVGQNIRTSLSQVVAEELRVPIGSIQMVMGDTALVPHDAGTFGSRSTPQMGTQLRKVAASARIALTRMAAEKWKTSQPLSAGGGYINDPASGRKISYGELAGGQNLLLPVRDSDEITPVEERKITGSSIPKVNLRSFITGRHKYISDMKVPQMLYAKVLRPPAYHAELTGVDMAAAKALPGVSIIQEGNFIAAVAESSVLAARAIRNIDAKWKTSPQTSRSGIFEHLRKTGSGGRSSQAKGDVNKGLAEADSTHKVVYHINYIAHVPLEPRAALAHWDDGKLTVYTGTQRPFGVQEDLAEVFNIPREKVRVIVPDTGSAYGGKHSGEAAVEAARISKAVNRPVKMVWTREEEFRWAYFRPAGVIEVNSGLKNDGTITAWDFHNYNSGPAAIATPYTVANQQNIYHPAETPLKQGSYRGLASVANVFARESHMGDLVRILKADQLGFRLKNLQEPRYHAVLEAAAKTFGWSQKNKQPNRGFGIATGFDKGGYVATCAEVEIIDKQVRVLRITEAFECGRIINPEHLHNQIIGAMVQGLGGALFESIDFENGRILNPTLSAYRVPRFSDLPEIDIVMIDRKDLPSSGAGEAPIIGVAPAIRNAILDASGVALMSLPLVPAGMLD